MRLGASLACILALLVGARSASGAMRWVPRQRITLGRLPVAPARRAIDPAATRELSR